MEPHETGPPVLVGELVPMDSTPRGSEVAVRPNVDVLDALALGWVESYDSDSPNTAERYARDVPGWTYKNGRVVRAEPRAPGSFFRWADDHGYDVFNMLPWHIDQYVRYLKTPGHAGRYTRSQKLSNATVAGKVAAVSSFYKYAARQSRDRVIPNPAAARQRTKVSATSTTRTLSREEIDGMLREARKRGNREYALVMLLATTGLRASEVCGLDTGDMIRDGGEWMLRVVRKGSGGERTLVPVTDVAARALRRNMRGVRGPMFRRVDGERMTRQALAYTVGVIARSAFPKLPDGTNPADGITPHVFRHSATTLAVQAGVDIHDVQALMGHASIKTTERYFHADRLRNNPAVRALGAMFEDGTTEEDDL